MPQKPDLIVLGDGRKLLELPLKSFSKQKRNTVVQSSTLRPIAAFCSAARNCTGCGWPWPYLALFGALLFWAFSWIIGKVVATSTLPAPLASALRMNLLGAFFLLWQLCHSALGHFSKTKSEQRKHWEADFLQHCRKGLIIDRKNLGYLVLSGMFFTVYNLCFFLRFVSPFLRVRAGILTSV